MVVLTLRQLYEHILLPLSFLPPSATCNIYLNIEIICFRLRLKTSVGDRRGRMVVDLKPSVKLVPITTKDFSSNPIHGEVDSIQHYAMKFVSDLG